MAKKSHIKVRMVPELNPDSKFIYYAKKPTKGEKAKEKLKLRKYNPNTRKHEIFIEKKFLVRIITSALALTRCAADGGGATTWSTG